MDWIDVLLETFLLSSHPLSHDKNYRQLGEKQQIATSVLEGKVGGISFILQQLPRSLTGSSVASEITKPPAKSSSIQNVLNSLSSKASSIFQSPLWKSLYSVIIGEWDHRSPGSPDPALSSFHLQSLPKKVRLELLEKPCKDWIPHLIASPGILEHGCQFAAGEGSSGNHKSKTSFISSVANIIWVRLSLILAIFVWKIWKGIRFVLYKVSGMNIFERLCLRDGVGYGDDDDGDSDQITLLPFQTFLLEWYIHQSEALTDFQKELFSLHLPHRMSPSELEAKGEKLVNLFFAQKPFASKVGKKVLTATLLKRVIPRHATYGWLRSVTAGSPVLLNEKFTPVLKQIFRNLQEIQVTKGDEDDIEIPSKRWIDIGFQGENPVTDFRSMGEFALVQLFTFSHLMRQQNLEQVFKEDVSGSKSFKTGRDIAIRALRDPFYSLAIVGINMTNRLLRWYWCQVPELDWYLEGSLNLMETDSQVNSEWQDIEQAYQEYSRISGLPLLSLESDNDQSKIPNIYRQMRMYVYLLNILFIRTVKRFDRLWESCEPANIMQFNIVFELLWQMRVIPFWRRGDWLSIYADEIFDESKSVPDYPEDSKLKTH